MKKTMDLTQKMDFGNHLEWTFSFFTKNFLFIFKTMSYFFIPGIVLFLIGGFFIYNYFVEWWQNFMALSMSGSTAIDDQSLTMFWEMATMYVLFIAVFSLYGLFMLAASGASIKAIGVIIEGTGETELDIVKFTLKKFLNLFITSLIVGFMLAFGFVCCYIPGLILMIYVIFYVQVIMLEDKGYFTAIGRSFSLVKKNFWMIVLLLLVIYFMYSFIVGMVTVPLIAVPYIKMINVLIQNEGVSDPALLTDIFKD
ncbi:MAG: hypothetical protein MJB14_02690, partial [Spirochaetes bacterium]|nr:hypothetical protein [Spirochaetota bacterium]